MELEFAIKKRFNSRKNARDRRNIRNIQDSIMSSIIMPPVTTDLEEAKSSAYGAGDLVISYLEQLGIEFVFGIPGGAIEPLYNALARSSRRGGLRPVVARHEASAAFMADGYTRETGKLGVCCATTGPGAT